jgi:3-phosphoshikimate 1-carboxyvinyltransferase
MIVKIKQTQMLQGSFLAPSSKSYTHRAFIVGTLSSEPTYICTPLYCEDTNVTLKTCKLFGAKVKEEKKRLTIIGPPKLEAPSKPIDCSKSGSTMRFMIPVATLAKGRTILTGSKGLTRRPIGPLVNALKSLGATCESTDGYPPVISKGKTLIGGKASLVGDVSSQFLTGLLLALPLAERDTEINVTTPLQSKPYIRLTLEILEKHGIVIHRSNDLQNYRIPSNQHYGGEHHEVPGDYSSTAFLMAAAALTSSFITVENLNPKDNQPDIQILDILREMGVIVKVSKNQVDIEGNPLEGIEVDVRDIPDLVPVIAALGCRARGTTKILKAQRLKLKESNRLVTVTKELRRFGARVDEYEGNLTITAPEVLYGTEVDSHGDHRIAMMGAILGLISKGETIIRDAECVSKSYPNFFNDLRNLGGNVIVR